MSSADRRNIPIFCNLSADLKKVENVKSFKKKLYNNF